MRKRKGSILKLLLLASIIIACIIYYINSYDKFEGIKVTEWNNIYNENNITIFYEDIHSELNKNLQNLDYTYKISEFLKEEDKEIEKVLKTVDIVKSIVNYDDVLDSTQSDGYSILKEKGENRKVSDRDMAIITRDIMLIAGYEARIGVLGKNNPHISTNPNYYVVEYWSKEYKKWIMIDFKDKGYLLSDNIPLSSIEVINSDLKEITYIGKETQKKYKRLIKDYLYSYTIPIDNTIANKRSNSYLSYIKNENNIEIELSDSFIPPTIFTMKEEVFNLSPDSKSEGKDSGAYIILMKKSLDSGANAKGKGDNTFILGAFKDGKILDSYYANINGEGYKSINKYTELNVLEGETKIEISLDGSNTVSNVGLVYKK